MKQAIKFIFLIIIFYFGIITINAQNLSQKYIDETMTISLVHNCGGNDINIELWTNNIIQKDKALYYLALTAYLNPAATSTDGKLVTDRIVEHLKNILTLDVNGKSQEPSCRGDLTGWKDIGQAFAIVFAKKTPQIWMKFTVEEINKLDWLMRAFAVTGNYHGNIQNWPSRCTYQSYSIGKTWNPNHNDGYVGIMIAVWYYFGGTAVVNQILADFKYDTYISTFNSLQFYNILETWTAYGTTSYPTGTNNAAMKLLLENPTGSAQYDKGNGKVFGARLPYIFGAPPAATQGVAYTPTDLYKALGAWMYPFTVTNKSTAGLAYILNGGSSPVLGKTGMCREFQVTDGFVPNVSERSDAQYCWWGWMMHIPVVSAMMALGDWPSNADFQDTERQMYVGSEDLMYKLKMGYHSYSKATAHDYYDYQYASQGYWYIVDIWNNYIKKRINKEPNISITSPLNNSVILSNSSITLSANASDNEGYIKKVEFYNGTKKMGEVTSAPFSHTWSMGLPVGDYNFIAKAYDDDGLLKADSIRFTIKTDASALAETKSEQLSVFPNPTENYFKFIIPDDAKRIKVINLQGKVMFEEIVKNNISEFGNEWNSGVYLLDVEFSKSSTGFKKLIKI